jgi:hypothetical protein
MGKNSNTGSLGRSLVKSRFTKNLLKTGESDKWVKQSLLSELNWAIYGLK